MSLKNTTVHQITDEESSDYTSEEEQAVVVQKTRKFKNYMLPNAIKASYEVIIELRNLQEMEASYDKNEKRNFIFRKIYMADRMWKNVLNHFNIYLKKHNPKHESIIHRIICYVFQFAITQTENESYTLVDIDAVKSIIQDDIFMKTLESYLITDFQKLIFKYAIRRYKMF